MRLIKVEMQITLWEPRKNMSELVSTWTQGTTYIRLFDSLTHNLRAVVPFRFLRCTTLKRIHIRDANSEWPDTNLQYITEFISRGYYPAIHLFAACILIFILEFIEMQGPPTIL